MSVKIRFEWLFAFGLLAGGQAWAQGPAGPDSYSSSPPIQAAPPEAYYGGPGAETYCPPATPDLYSELLPSDRGWKFDNDSRRDLYLKQMFRGAFFRMEYLQGTIQHSGDTTLGTPLNITEPATVPGPAQDVVNVANQFLIIINDASSPATNATDLGYRYAQVATTEGIQWDDAQGLRAGFGIRLSDAVSVEAAFIGYMHQNAYLQVPTIPVPNALTGDSLSPPFLDLAGNTIIPGTNAANATSFLATTLTTDGVPGSRLILYDAGFSSLYKSRYLGGDVDLVFNWKNPQEGLRLQPILGYRHEQYSEFLAFSGTFDNRSAFYENVGVYATPQTNLLESEILNQRDQIEFGLRNEIAWRFLTLGAQEKFALGSNVIRHSVATVNFREPGTVSGSLDDPDTLDRDRRVVFAPTFDFDVYAKIRMTEWFNIRVGYNLICMGNVGVADKSIRFNEVSNGAGGTDLDVGSRLSLGHRVINAFTIGGEIVIP